MGRHCQVSTSIQLSGRLINCYVVLQRSGPIENARQRRRDERLSGSTLRCPGSAPFDPIIDKGQERFSFYRDGIVRSNRLRCFVLAASIRSNSYSCSGTSERATASRRAKRFESLSTGSFRITSLRINAYLKPLSLTAKIGTLGVLSHGIPC